MKKNVLGILMMVMIAFVACAGKKKITKKQAVNSKIEVTYVQMSRTACFGRCPEYSIELYKEGLVRYTGRRNVKDTGVYEKNVTSAKVAEVLGDFNTYRIDTCRDQYEMLVTDLPGITYVIKYNGKTKTIRNASFGPEFLKALARSMDNTAVVDRSWRKISATSKQD